MIAKNQSSIIYDGMKLLYPHPVLAVALVTGQLKTWPSLTEARCKKIN